MTSETLEAMFAAYYNDALFYALSLTKDKALAEDLVSAAFFKALQTLDDENESFKSWLLTVVRNGYYSHLRRHKRQTELDERMHDEEEALLERIVKDEEYRALYHAIALLPPNYREAITLFYFENLTIKEMSRVLKKGETVVKTTLCRARIKLKELLES